VCGIKTSSIIQRNPHHSPFIFIYSVAELYEYALQPEHLASTDPSILPTKIADTGALVAYSGSKMGRTPNEKRIVEDDGTKKVRFVIS